MVIHQYEDAFDIEVILLLGMSSMYVTGTGGVVADDVQKKEFPFSPINF